MTDFMWHDRDPAGLRAVLERLLPRREPCRLLAVRPTWSPNRLFDQPRALTLHFPLSRLLVEFHGVDAAGNDDTLRDIVAKGREIVLVASLGNGFYVGDADNSFYRAWIAVDANCVSPFEEVAE